MYLDFETEFMSPHFTTNALTSKSKDIQTSEANVKEQTGSKLYIGKEKLKT